MAGRGYGARAILDLIAAQGGRCLIPAKRDRKVQCSVDRPIYRQRNLVERFFGRLGHLRKISTQYEKAA